MEPLLAIVALAVLLSPILAIAALVQGRGVQALTRQVRDLQRRLDAALERIDELQGIRRSAPPPSEDANEAEPMAPEPPPPRGRPLASTREDAPIEAAPPPPLVQPEPPTRAPVAPRPAAPAKPGVEWERWIGVRGAAVVGGALLALAGLLLVRHMIDQGLLGPGARVSTTTAIGAALVALFPWLVQRGYRIQAACSGGAGIVMLYGAAWASAQLYGFIGTPLAFAAMSATTAVSLWLSSRHRTRTLMVFAALGGFATPLVLGTWRESPVGLHAYALLLDGALLLVARGKEWRWVQFAALGGTVLLHVVWAPFAATAATAPVGLVALFVLGLAAACSRESRVRIAGAASAIGLAFLYGLKADLDVELWQLGLAWIPGAAVLAWTSRERPEVVLAAAGAVVGLALAWIGQRGYSAGHAWQMVVTLGLAGAALTAALRVSRRPRSETRAGSRSETHADTRSVAPEFGVVVIALGLAVGVFASAIVAGATVGVVLATATAATALGLAVGVAREEHLVNALPVVGIGAGLVATRVPEPWSAVPAIAAVCALLAWARRTGPARRRTAALAAVAALAPPLFALPLPYLEGGAGGGFLTAPLGALAVAIVGTAAALRARAPVAHAVAVAAVAISAWTWDLWGLRAARGAEEVGAAVGGVLALRVAAAAVLALAPLAAARGREFAWHAAALAPALLFVPGETSAWSVAWGDGHAAWMPAALGAVAAAGAFLCRTRGLGRFALARSGAVAIALVSIAVAQRFGPFWPLMAPVVGGAAAALLARRHGHRRLFGACFGGWCIGAVMLLGAAAGAGTIAQSDWLLSPRLAWLFLVPAATAALLLARDRGWIRARARACVGVLAALHVFAWINLTVFDGFGASDVIVADWTRSQAQNLTQSAAWIAYALALLGAGAVARLGELRWLSLAFLSLALLKVGLWDLRALDGLHRVASTAGMSLALLAVSLSYQRFVFR